ncbi:hypothetical protein ABBQ38_014715 [Trebouxia sp. C0009 RCD-2024]
MAFRMICKTLTSRSLAAVSRAAPTHCTPSCSLLRHAAAAGANRPAWRSDTTSLISLRNFNTSMFARSALTDILQEEIVHEKETYQPPEEVISGPPEGWQLTETPGDTHMTLKKTHGSEKIQIDLMVNDQPVDPGEVYQEMAEGDNEEVDVDVGVHFNASVTKGEQSLVFECKSDGTYLDIQHLSLELTDESPEESTYTGPVYANLDEKLLQEFPAYLEERGIDADMGNYLLALVNDKEEREYKSWLEHVQKFLKK